MGAYWPSAIHLFLNSIPISLANTGDICFGSRGGLVRGLLWEGLFDPQFGHSAKTFNTAYFFMKRLITPIKLIAAQKISIMTADKFQSYNRE
jgi:hypothetical protein